MTVRIRLLIVTIVGLALTMVVWGWIQLEALDKILVDQQIKRLYDVAETINTYYQHFPTRRGLSALDMTLRELMQTDPRFARIDIFAVDKDDADYIAGASRLQYEWPEDVVVAAAEQSKPRYIELNTDRGAALGLLYPFALEKDTQLVVGVISFSQARTEILSRAKGLLFISTTGLLAVILLVMGLGYGWLIGRPLGVIISTIDEFAKGGYVKRIPLSRRDEWGHLTDHFNSMADEIERVHEQIQELNRHLEDRVQETTLKVVQLQQQVNQLQKLAALGYLTATLAHDLGTPLHSIAGLAQLLMERENWPPDVSRKLELIVQQTQRLHTVIQNVRRATRPPEPHFEATLIQDLFNETLPLVEPLLQKSGIQIEVHVEEGLPILYLDRYRVQTALFNLIQNAIEVMPTGGEIRVGAFGVRDKHSIAMSVQDNGPGIPPELMEKVCEPFFSTHEDEGLRGLGLAIVHDIVKMHGGEMEIKNRPEGGTEVTLYFPFVDKASPDAPSGGKPSLSNP